MVRRRREPSSAAGASAAGSRLDARLGRRVSSESPAPKSLSEARSNSKDCSLSLTGPSPTDELVRRVGRFEELGRSVGMKDSKMTHSIAGSKPQPHRSRFDCGTETACVRGRVKPHRVKHTHPGSCEIENRSTKESSGRDTGRTNVRPESPEEPVHSVAIASHRLRVAVRPHGDEPHGDTNNFQEGLERDCPIREMSASSTGRFRARQTRPHLRARGPAPPEGLRGSQQRHSANRTSTGEGMIQPAGANIPNSGPGFTKRMSSNDIHHTAHFT